METKKMTGIELIAKEREEQIKKHGYDENHDEEHKDGQIIEAVIAVLDINCMGFPYGWEDFNEKVTMKPYKEKLIIAGALIAAEIDRLQNK